MKLNVSKFRRRWRAAVFEDNTARREAKVARLVEVFGAQPIRHPETGKPTAYRLPTGDAFCLKRPYPTVEAAQEALAEVRRNPRSRKRRECVFYACNLCREYHLASKRPEYIADMSWERAQNHLLGDAP